MAAIFCSFTDLAKLARIAFRKGSVPILFPRRFSAVAKPWSSPSFESVLRIELSSQQTFGIMPRVRNEPTFLCPLEREATPSRIGGFADYNGFVVFPFFNENAKLAHSNAPIKGLALERLHLGAEKIDSSARRSVSGQLSAKGKIVSHCAESSFGPLAKW